MIIKKQYKKLTLLEIFAKIQSDSNLNESKQQYGQKTLFTYKMIN